jgi:hypothetical protein
VVWVEEEPALFRRRAVKIGMEQEDRVQIREASTRRAGRRAARSSWTTSGGSSEAVLRCCLS